MGLFDNMLKGDESLFRDTVALDYDFLPKIIPYRSNEQQKIAFSIKPLFQDMNGRNLIIHGPPGIGKTAACRHVLRELEEQTDRITPIYINCWKKNSSYKLILEICDQIGYRLTHNKSMDELQKIIKSRLNSSSTVLVLDEIDKLQDYDFFYFFLEEVYRKTILLITNYPSWITRIDERIKSRLTPEVMEFKEYNELETKGILKERLQYAFSPGVWNDDAFSLVANKTWQIKDIRTGLYLMKESGICAEEKASRKITTEHVNMAINKIDSFSIKDKEQLQDDKKTILSLLTSEEIKIGDLFTKYREHNGEKSYKSFQRYIQNLEQNSFIDVRKVTNSNGNTTMIKKKDMSLNDF